ncbi:MAG TPA: TetR/AcrR family transcriptional regulator [Chloroflexota bacterium]|nr:TetR/AcrR family transcriptional regulator [Chloroflexota bacterium]
MQSNSFLDHENAERILEEGWLMFQRQGYRGVTIDALCLQCGVTKPTLYYYFHDKENLFVQVLQHKLRGFRKVIEQPGSLDERLQHTALSILESFQTEYSSLLRDRTHIKDPENVERVRVAFHAELFGPLAVLMQAGIDEGNLRGDDPDLLTLVFLGILNSFIGKAIEMHVENAVLAGQLTGFFLDGARLSRLASPTKIG